VVFCFQVPRFPEPLGGGAFEGFLPAVSPAFGLVVLPADGAWMEGSPEFLISPGIFVWS
jgi:hypothetical protein